MPVGSSPTLVGTAKSDDKPEFGLDAVPSLPALEPPRWCWDGQPVATCFLDSAGCGLTPRACSLAEIAAKKGCVAGSYPRVDEKGEVTCRAAGVPWLCPDGFIEGPEPTDPTQLRGCVPDPKRCPTDKWGPSSAPDVLHVDAAAGLGNGDGSAAKPFPSIGHAWSKVKPGSTILLAEGTYSLQAFTEGINLHGVCAAKVKIVEPTSSPAVDVAKAGKLRKLGLRDLTISGAHTGIVARDGWQITGRRLYLHKLKAAGGAALHKGSSLTLEDSVIADVRAVPGHVDGGGILATNSGTVVLRRVRITSVNSYGVACVAEARCVLEDVVVDGLIPIGKSGLGVTLTSKSHAVLRGVRVHRSYTVGVQVATENSSVHIQGLHVDHPQTLPTVSYAHGVAVREGSKAWLAGSHVDGCVSTGVLVYEKGSTLHAAGLRVSDTFVEPVTHTLGIGLILREDTETDVVGLWVQRAAKQGLVVQGKTTSLKATDVLVSDIRGTPSGTHGWGIAVLHGTLDLRRVRIDKSRQYGLYVAEEGAVARVRGLLVTNNQQALPEKAQPFAIVTVGQAALHANDVRLSNNDGGGIKAEVYVDVAIAGLLVDGSRPRETIDGTTGELYPFKHAVHLGVSHNSTLHLSGARLTEGQLAAVALAGAKVHLVADGLVVDRCRPEPKKKAGGLGIDVYQRAKATLRSTVFVGNHTGAVFVDDGDLLLEESVVRNTRPAVSDVKGQPEQVFADGIVVLAGGSVTLRRSVVHAHKRAGVLVDGKSKGQPSRAVLDRTMIHGCGFGLVTQSGATAAYSKAVIDGSSSANITTDGSLPVPSSPAVVSAAP